MMGKLLRCTLDCIHCVSSIIALEAFRRLSSAHPFRKVTIHDCTILDRQQYAMRQMLYEYENTLADICPAVEFIDRNGIFSVEGWGYGFS
jgi:hypothetical protein